jgi:hypothetical protein
MRMAGPQKNKKSGIYEYRVRVPADVIEAFGAANIKRSLKTRDPAEAKRLFNLMHGENEAIWAQLRVGVVQLSQRQMVALSGEYYRKWLETFHEDAGSTAAYQNLTEMTEGLADDDERLAVWYGRATDALLLSKGLKISREQRTALLREMYKADHQARRQLQKNTEGDYRDDPDGSRYPEWSAPNAAKDARPEIEDQTLVAFFEWWKTTHLADGKAPKTIQDSRQKLDSLIAFVGHGVAERVTKQDIDRWCEYLRV